MTNSKSTTKKTFALFLYHMLQYKRFMIPLFLVVPINVLIMDFALPFIMSLVLQKISTNNFDANHLWDAFGAYIVIYAILIFASAVAGWRLVVWLVWNLELRVTRDMSHRIFSHLMDLSPGFHANRFAGSLVSQANKLTGAYVRLMDSAVFSFYTLVISMIATMTILFPRVPTYTGMLFVLSMVYIIGTMYFSRPVREANTAEAEQQSRQTGNLADSLSNIMAIKSFAALKYEKNRYLDTAEDTLQTGMVSLKKTMIRETYSSVVTSSIAVAALAIAVLGAGRFDINIATLFLMVTYTNAIGHRLWEFQSVLRNYNRALGDASDMVKILDIKPDIADPIKPKKAHIVRGDIRLKNMFFTHDENNSALFEDINLHIKQGEKVGLVGHSGSGKTTLTKLLLRFADIDKGEILIDGQDIRSIKQDDLRARIAYVPQEPLLFHRTLAENISYGEPKATQKQIEIIAKMANAHEFIDDLPAKYKTLVGERGVKLSGGQRQRVAIARAMLKNAPILLLDEATSALDSESETLIQEALWKLMEGRTAIVIAHRLSTIQKMDRIIVLDHGKILEQGSHKELIQKNGAYAELWSHQSGGFIKD